MAQNYGCLPSPIDTVYMRVKHGKTWACHSNQDKPCLGTLNRLKELGHDNKVIDKELLIEQSPWNLYCKLPEDSYDIINTPYKKLKGHDVR